MTDFTIKQSDTSPNIKAQLTDENNDPVDLSSVNSVTFHMENYNTGEVIIEKSAVIDDATEGIVYYNWDSTDTATAGIFNAEWQVDFGGDVVETYPNHDFLKVEIVEEIV